MSTQYLLPCSCGQKLRVESAQAGGQVTCACGQKLTVPTLRGLRQLEEAKPDEAAKKRAAGRQWGPVQGALFSVGTLVLVIALGIVIYTFVQYRRIQAAGITQDPTPVINQYEAQQIDEFTLMQALEVFEEFRTQGLGEKHEPYWISAQKAVAQQRTLMVWCGGFAAAGVLAIACALLIRPARQT
jgi:hypothetical protein